ncbi:amine dehydrogenase large subunit [Burkholderia stabilis]|uniref:amine dehydrogenase large subunit n=1 Tax=Burkholderia stabilis TaxID=95485 RepID=UPI001F4A3605|nr:amine dehydrogenase large subunit [Burkholderia stabilis]
MVTRCMHGVALMFMLAALTTAGATPPLRTETLSVEPVPQPGPHWVYLIDAANSHMVDAKLIVYDADRRRIVAQLGAGAWPGFAAAPDRREHYIATSYMSRGTRGVRTDVLEINDNRTFEKAGEVVLPPKHMQVVTASYDTTVSGDGRFAFVSNVTPAMSITVVDLAHRRVASEIDTAGCVLAYPSGVRRVTALCESGRALTVTIGDDGRETARRQSDPFIDVDRDPFYVNARRIGERYLFLSHHGWLREADFSHGAGRFGTPWSLVDERERAAGWRPGGNQPFAVNTRTGRLYVAMHRGVDGSHKDPGTEIWVYDLAHHTRLARWNLAERQVAPVTSLEVSQDDRPVVYGTGGADLSVFDGASGKLLVDEKQIGESVDQLVAF